MNSVKVIRIITVTFLWSGVAAVITTIVPQTRETKSKELLMAG
jgi:hypothetical protein